MSEDAPQYGRTAPGQPEIQSAAALTARWKRIFFGTDPEVRKFAHDVLASLEAAEREREVYGAELTTTHEQISHALPPVDGAMLHQRAAQLVLKCKAEREHAETLLAAIKTHADQRADDRCWLDDVELYKAAGLPEPDNRVGDKSAMLENCRRFVEQRCEDGGPWRTYAELTRDKERMRAELLDLRREDRRTHPIVPREGDHVHYCPACQRDWICVYRDCGWPDEVLCGEACCGKVDAAEERKRLEQRINDHEAILCDLQERAVQPLPAILHCPRCGLQHIDAPEPESGWMNPPHRSHLCASCGCVWRPANVATTGNPSTIQSERSNGSGMAAEG